MTSAYCHPRPVNDSQQAARTGEAGTPLRLDASAWPPMSRCGVDRRGGLELR
ncbi:hypothetical protein TPAR_04231 [Tolypocladium paradoxum]|uniref:Uncharacterized protein n=1 Tax=Tolypocladium paradoxum TaxID=94208 RepID=A0A2S4KZC7_9HYPO|nr:hypothetical protein TPAR_04231 [Tolypocladium paradoxum]